MNIVFIDISYFIFYRYHALANWYKMRNPDSKIDPETMLTDDDFVAKFKKRCRDTFGDIEKRYRPDRVFICRDCPRKDIWRMALLPDYKGSRAPFSAKGIFGIFFDEVLPDVIKDDTKYRLMGCERCEADDVVAMGVKTLNAIRNDLIFTIVTSDHDYLQLLRYTNLDIVDLKFKSLRSKSIGDNDLLYKVLLGDKSDNIPGVKRRLGKKTIGKLIENDALGEFIKSDPDINAKYNLNRELIDFERIPDALKENIRNLFINTISC